MKNRMMGQTTTLSTLFKVATYITAAAAIIIFSPSPDVLAQMQMGGDMRSGNYIDRLPAPVLKEGFGNSHIEITTASEEAQQFFDQGLSLLHDYWELEAYRSFKHAARLDPMAPMAHWGVAFSINRGGYARERAEEYRHALDQAHDLAIGATEVEQLLIEATWLRDSIGGSDGKEAYESTLETVVTYFPEEINASLLLARSVGFRTPYGRSLLSNVLERSPGNHAVHHFRIHSYEWDFPERILESADLIMTLSPASGHMVHMPGHVYYRLGEYQKARDAFVASNIVERSFVEEFGIHPSDNGMQPHNLHYLLAALAELGQYREAELVAQELRGLAVADPDRELAPGMFPLFYQALLGPARLEMRFGHWAKAVSYIETIPVNTDESPIMSVAGAVMARTAWLEFSRGMANLAAGKLEEAERAQRRLESALWRGSEDGTLGIFNGWLERRMKTAALELRGNVLSYRGDHEEAIEMLGRAVEAEDAIGISEPPYYLKPVRESLAEAQRRAGEFEEARATYRELLAERRNSGFALFGIAEVLAEQGQDEMAREAYSVFLNEWDEADRELPQVVTAEAALR